MGSGCLGELPWAQGLPPTFALEPLSCGGGHACSKDTVTQGESDAPWTTGEPNNQNKNQTKPKNHKSDQETAKKVNSTKAKASKNNPFRGRRAPPSPPCPYPDPSGSVIPEVPRGPGVG